MVYHERALHYCFISYLRKYSGQQNQCETRAAFDGKVGCNTVEYKTALLYYDWPYLLWYDINQEEIHQTRETVFHRIHFRQRL